MQYVLDTLVLWVNMFPVDEEFYLTNEMERAYYHALFAIKDSIGPESLVFEENADGIVDTKLASEWSERLNVV